MKNEKESKTASKKTASDKTPAKKQTAKKGTKPASGDGASSKPKGKAAEKADSKTLYAVIQSGGPIQTISRKLAIDDCLRTKTMTQETIETMLGNGEVVYSEDSYYATTPEALKKWEKAPEQPQALPVVGDVVFHAEKNTFGEIFQKEDMKLRVLFKEGDRDKSMLLNKTWELASAAQTTAYNDAKQKAIALREEQAIKELPLSEKELTRLEKLEKKYVEIEETEKIIPFAKGRILNEIRRDRLYRDSYKTFGEYALAKFGITREYAQLQAQIGDFAEIVDECVATGKQFDVSVRSATAMIRDTNKMTKLLGVGDVEFGAIKPILTNVLALMSDIAPKDEVTGQPVITQRFVNSFNESLTKHITDGVVEIEGKQMTIKAAEEKGLLNHSLREEVIQGAAEGILTQSEVIKREAKKAYARQNDPVKNAGLSDAKEIFEGRTPKLSVVCSKHKETEVLSIGNGRMQTVCECRWHVDAESGKLVAFEVEGKKVKR